MGTINQGWADRSQWGSPLYMSPLRAAPPHQTIITTKSRWAGYRPSSSNPGQLQPQPKPPDLLALWFATE